jgi:hypothetical protein
MFKNFPEELAASSFIHARSRNGPPLSAGGSSETFETSASIYQSVPRHDTADLDL